VPNPKEQRLKKRNGEKDKVTTSRRQRGEREDRRERGHREEGGSGE
jgi:hypothetical protein